MKKDKEIPLFETPSISMEEQKPDIIKEPIAEEPEINEIPLDEPAIMPQSEEYKTFAKTVHSIIFSVAKLQVEEEKRTLLDDSGARILHKYDKWQLIEKYGAEATYLMLWGDILQVNFFSKKAEVLEKEESYNPIKEEKTPQTFKEERREADFTSTLARL